MDWAVDSQSEGVVSVKFTRKRQPYHSRAARTSLVIKYEANQPDYSNNEPIAAKIIIGCKVIANRKPVCVFVPNCLYHVIKSHTRLIGPEDIYKDKTTGFNSHSSTNL